MLQTVKTSIWVTVSLLIFSDFSLKGYKGWRSNWDHSTSHGTWQLDRKKRFLHLLHLWGAKTCVTIEFTSKSTASSHSHSGVHSEERGNLEPHQPPNKIEKPLITRRWSGVYKNLSGPKRQSHRICPQTAQWIDKVKPLVQMEWLRLLSAYLCYRAVRCLISTRLNSVLWETKLLLWLHVGLSDMIIKCEPDVHLLNILSL